MEMRDGNFGCGKLSLLVSFNVSGEESGFCVRDYLLLFIIIFWVDEYFVFAVEILFYLVIKRDKKYCNGKPDLNEGMESRP